MQSVSQGFLRGDLGHWFSYKLGCVLELFGNIFWGEDQFLRPHSGPTKSESQGTEFFKKAPPADFNMWPGLRIIFSGSSLLRWLP